MQSYNRPARITSTKGEDTEKKKYQSNSQSSHLHHRRRRHQYFGFRGTADYLSTISLY